MCLIIKKHCEIATEDIICYKVLQRIVTLNTQIWKTPNGTLLPDFHAWRNCKGYVQEIPEGSKFLMFEKPESELTHPAIHSFTDLQAPGINSIMKSYLMSQRFECIIPKGTKYYSGIVKYGNYWINEWNISDSYASERIIYRKLITSI